MSIPKLNPTQIRGLVGPAFLVVIAVVALTQGEASYAASRYGSRMHLTGFDSVLFAIALMGGAVALHGHEFWGESERLWPYAPILIGVGAVGIIIPVFWLLFRQFANFI